MFPLDSHFNVHPLIFDDMPIQHSNSEANCNKLPECTTKSYGSLVQYRSIVKVYHVSPIKVSWIPLNPHPDLFYTPHKGKRDQHPASEFKTPIESIGISAGLTKSPHITGTMNPNVGVKRVQVIAGSVFAYVGFKILEFDPKIHI